MNLEHTSCCALDEISGITGGRPDAIIDFAYHNYYCEDRRCAFYLFTDTSANDYKSGNALARYIKNNKLGRVIVTRARKNPNSGNFVKVYMWEVFKKSLLAWGKKNHDDECNGNYNNFWE